jgi:DNA-directed DNA polymerase III PolC
MTAYDLCKKKGLSFVPGLQIFFKDDRCDILAGTRALKSRYARLTLYANDQKGFHALAMLASKSGPHLTSYGVEYALHDWQDIKWAAENGLFAVSSGASDVVFKPLVFKQPLKTSETLASRLKQWFGDRYAIAIAEKTASRAYKEITCVSLANGSTVFLMADDRVITDRSRNVRASEISENQGRHKKLIAANSAGRYRRYDSEIISVSVKKGFVSTGKVDYEAVANRAAQMLATKLGIPLIYSDHAFYATPEDRVVQDVRLTSESHKEYGYQHMRTTAEALEFLRSQGCDPESVVAATNAWAQRFAGFKLSYKPQLPSVPGGKSSLEVVAAAIAAENRMPDDPRYKQRLKKEIDVLMRNGTLDLLPYFLPIRDVIAHYKSKNEIVGPGRGSAAGSLLAYLMGITDVDPIKYDLSFERFISLDRVKTGSLPDIDSDFPHREHLVGADGKSGYLYGRYGDCAAQISTRTMLRLKSAIKDVNRYFRGAVEPEIEALTKALPDAPQGVSDSEFVFGHKDDDDIYHPGLIETNKDLFAYAEKRPQEWGVVQRCLGLTRQWSRHASAFLISDDPIKVTAPIFLGNATQYDAKGAEKAGLIKYDFLVVNHLKDINLCVQLVNKKQGGSPGYGSFYSNGKPVYIWDLPEEPEVFQSIWSGATETVFQLHTAAMTPFVKKIKPNTVEDLAVISALVRPGPLDFIDEKTGRNMADEYVARRDGRSRSDIPELGALLPETYGVLVYQEQVSRVSRELGNMDPLDAEELRRLFSKKQKVEAGKMKPKFMAGATERVGAEVAEKIWQQMETFSRYGFNKSHAVSYAFISYACMYLKHHFPLEWWTAILTNADESEISGDLFKHVRELMIPPDINHSTDSMTIDYERHKIRAKLTVIRGLGDAVVAPIVAGRPYTDIQDFVNKRVAGPSLTKKLIHVGVLDSLFPAQATLVEKMYAFEAAVIDREYEEKLAAGKKPRQKPAPVVDPEYFGVHPLDDFIMRKQILATLPIRLTDLVVAHGGLLNEGRADRIAYGDERGYVYPLLNAEGVARVEAMQPDPDGKGIYFCFAGYVVDCEEFSFAKNTKKALKFSLDVDGQVSERVIWPDYNTGELRYPEGFAKGAVVLLFAKKKPGNKGTAIYSAKVIRRIDKAKKTR